MNRKPMVETSILLTILAIVAFCIGCAGAPLQEQGNSDPRSVYVIEPGIKGRGCLYTRVQQFGEGKSDVEVIVAQDGTSDWSVSRLFGLFSDVAGAIFGGERRQDNIGTPDSLQGCSQLFERAKDEPAPEEPPAEVVVPRVEFEVDEGPTELEPGEFEVDEGPTELEPGEFGSDFDSDGPDSFSL